MWNILLATEQKLAWSVLAARLVRLQVEYMGTRRTKITVHGVPVDISEDCVGSFFAKYGQVEVCAINSKCGIVTGDIELHVILTR